jgi:ClpP class serine protease
VDKSGAAFCECVAAGRNIDAAKVKKTEARVYRADDALSLGLIDTIATPQEAMQVFFDELSGSLSTQPKEDAMSGTTNAQPGNPTATNAAPAQAAAPAGVTAEQVASLVAAGIAADRARMSGITGCEEAKGREKLANHLAMNTGMDLDAAKLILAAAPKEAAPAAAAPGAAFQAAMASTPNPQVGADTTGNGGGQPNTPADKAAGILGDFYAVTGEKPAQAKAH